jgi:hypothetical protein
LFGLFGRGARRARDTLKNAVPEIAPGAAPQAPAPSPPRRLWLRPPDETVAARQEAPGAWTVDLRGRPLAEGSSLRVVGEGLAEPLVLVRVHATHLAAARGQCALDGSDLLWISQTDRLYCPGCTSRWRLDGTPARGPAIQSLASYVVEESAGVVSIRAPGAAK